MSRKPNKQLSVEEAQKLFNQAKNVLTDAKARHKAIERKGKKKRDDQRKILAGAWVLSVVQKDADFKASVLAGLDQFLTRPIDRAAFPELK